jgi:hypothetical protein
VYGMSITSALKMEAVIACNILVIHPTTSEFQTQSIICQTAEVLLHLKPVLQYIFTRYIRYFLESSRLVACIVEDLDRDYKNRNIYILSDSQAAIKHFVNIRSPQNCSGIATDPSYNWPDITEFN